MQWPVATQLVRLAERKQRYPANGEAPFPRQPSAERRAGADCADRDGRWLDRWSNLYDLLFGTELVSCSDVARAMALRATQLLNVCSEA